MKKNKKGVYPYKNIVDALQKSARREGVLNLWVGFPNFYIRCGSHIIIHLILLDSVTQRYN
jgi:solute carrier family 25 oxoglutarate transporter 11